MRNFKLVLQVKVKVIQVNKGPSLDLNRLHKINLRVIDLTN